MLDRLWNELLGSMLNSGELHGANLFLRTESEHAEEESLEQYWEEILRVKARQVGLREGSIEHTLQGGEEESVWDMTIYSGEEATRLMESLVGESLSLSESLDLGLPDDPAVAYTDKERRRADEEDLQERHKVVQKKHVGEKLQGQPSSR